MLLQMRQITKTYGNLTANSNVDFSLRQGEIHALVGENGAGKTTLMRILYGMEQPTAGDILLNGKEVAFTNPTDAIRHRVGMVHQHFMLFPSFTVAENIVIGNEPKSGLKFDRKKAVKQVEALCAQYRLPIDPNKKVADIPLGMQQRVEILKVLYQGADIIILDEPTGVLTPLEAKELLVIMRNLANQGKSFIIITHKLHEVMEIADRVTVLRDGKVTGELDAGATNVEELSKLMVGRDLLPTNKSDVRLGETVLQVKDVSIMGGKGKPVLDKVSFHVKAGEIVGIAGISGNGQSELIQAISGLQFIDHGEIRLLGDNLKGRSVREIRDIGLSHVPEDRYQWGAAKEGTVLENGTMGHHRTTSRKGFLQGKELRQMVDGFIKQFQIKAGSQDAKVKYLSGGNLQKLIVAREIAQKQPFLIAAEPTRGVDIGAMELIHEELLRKRDEQGAILLVSSELTEILKLSDRIIVMYEGRIAGEISAENATEEQISLWMAGGVSHA
ncbi:ABC transporter ATP-binding protein [Paenibacillus sp. CGMCC 1.16610]|uniref:ATP-binding cassette domain-containing protein n=1 Tax=Paenibacillus anseongense TaxID=2682845 RepID=A0ABW9UB76_9BACL|nr:MULTISPECIES: ABC transporter ATP-binding protein [Paenibacillus]MBA2938341.1 ABC transporter ATP-binding protein [Paenibacillus sp. CGMCC 1.16610]MVQ37399.1 ATP-binding cassette domain-containing protein [Paenibacillus anseongense]